ncbi:putative ABC transport system ATP-binding protein [Chitinivorax tropicus]|uniref:Putative ABC transport system ATP-binding protein n=1 Tax=Chitinivorax tropicus TaxID=714531 RepID=A0A840MTE1_9PROT|nr:ABC transporter ATP-binding protein [Chitinivorax tropicus]MBB5019543.1 putative ABC transport system ATP-binding protein [Chitinivorax tropicus]
MNVASSVESAIRNQLIVRADQLVKQVPMADEQLTILHGIDLSIAQGESLAIIGASGSGKSTLLGLLAGLDVPTSGDVWLGDAQLSALDEDGRARLRGELVGFVFQSFQLLPALTALENVMLPLELAAKPDAEKTAREWLGRVGLGGRLTHYPKQLSGGEQQRVALARAFAGNPRLLFADEPTGNLDTATGQQIVELLFSLNREQGTTLVLVTHDPQLAERCHRHVRIAAGRVVEDDAS